jgi:predicted unusual protein kinase regulating ubiquinone biosynthesis (AarF/ABC1/UbiB family)
MPAMKRSHGRWRAFLQSGLSRIGAHWKSVLLGDEELGAERGVAERARAREFARWAAELRGGMAKLGQLQAYLEGPAEEDREARETLGRLWDQVPGESPETVGQVIREDLGAAPEALFARWEGAPLAAASLGQVHAAESHEGEKLAVKVQYPGVAEALRDDLESGALVRQLVGAEVGHALSAEAEAALRERILGELDYRAEAEYLGVFRRAFAGDAQIVVPRVFPKLSSARVLTMERIEGRSLSEFAGAAGAAERNAAARTLLRFAWGGPLRHGLLNADPNPGNYLMLEPAGRVGFLDFGCVVRLEEGLGREDRRLWMAVIHRDGETLRHAFYRQGLVGDVGVLDGAAYRAWEQRLTAPFLARGAYALEPGHVRELVRLTGVLVRNRGLELPPTALLLWRQRLGALSVMAALRPRIDFRAALAELLDDGHHPQPLIERYP